MVCIFTDPLFNEGGFFSYMGLLKKTTQSLFHISLNSSIYLPAIRNISKKRIIKEIRPYISKSIQRDIKNKLCSFFK